MTELHLRRHMAVNPHWFDIVHRRWAAPLRAAGNARFPMGRDAAGRFSHEGNET